MTTINSHSLFHITHSFSILKKIITNGLRYSYSLEKTDSKTAIIQETGYLSSYSDRKLQENGLKGNPETNVAIPMICFCDIPLLRIEDHCKKYGKIAIGLNKELFSDLYNNQINPIWYYLLPYTGAGSGIQRAMSEDNRLSFSNNEALHEFVITIARDLDTNSDTLLPDLDTKRQNLDTDSDTFNVNSDIKEQDIEADSDTFEADSNTKNRIKLNKKQKDIINFCNIPRSSKEILERVGISYHSKNIEKYINLLVKAGYLEMTNPENPNASNQKYRRKIKK